MLTKQSSWWNTRLAKGAPVCVRVCVWAQPEGFCVKITCIVYLDHFYSSLCCSFCCYCFCSWREKLSCWRINHCGNWVSHIKAHAWLNCIQFAHVTMMMMIIIVDCCCLCDCSFAESETEIERKRCRCFDRLAGRLRKSMNCKKNLLFSLIERGQICRSLLCWEFQVLIDSIGLESQSAVCWDYWLK